VAQVVGHIELWFQLSDMYLTASANAVLIFGTCYISISPQLQKQHKHHHILQKD
jgi:uncharacterized membrane protein